ncbi:hypothetical protein G3O07_19210, partial [Pseudomonas laurentiana]|nr:hypothetical protein [Pseudomonas laurentiana]
MAVRFNDKLQKIFNGLNTDRRFATWLWFLIRGNLQNINLGKLGSPDMRDRMAEVIINQPGLKQSIENQKSTNLLPEQSFQWITNNKRQNAFIIRKLTEKNGTNYTNG